MTRATHWDRGWPKKVAACGANAAPHGSNIRTDADAVTCKRCRKIIDWNPPRDPEASPTKPAERRATVADGETRLALLERLLGELKKLICFDGDEFARLATDTNDNGGTDWWFECHKCGEIIEGTEDLTDEKANGNVFKCSCGQEFIGSTHIMLHAIEAARAATGGGR
jgi:hypothetical protein